MPTGLDQNFAPFTERKVRFANSFLPISALFHSPCLQPATGIILDDLKEIEAFTRQDLVIPIFYTSTDPDLYDVLGDESMISELVDMITQLPVHWEAARVFPRATHILEFGSGAFPGLVL